jgi:6-phosphogluconolactonase
LGSHHVISIRTIVLLFVAVAHTLLLAQTNFVYTNNNNYFTANTISGYSVGPSGTVTQLSNSPFSTGGTGNGGNGRIATNRIAACSKFLFASNDFSGDVSAFSINAKTGNLIAVPGSPFAAGGNSSDGIAVAVSPRCNFLFVANLDAYELFAFSIEANGSLVPVQGSPFSVQYDEPTILAVSADGAFLALAFYSLPNVGIYTVGSGGVLTTVPGSPFPLSQSAGSTGGMDFNCDASRLYVPELDDQVDVLSVAADGVLSLIPGSPFSSPSGDYVSGLSPSGKILLTSNGSSGVNIFKVGVNGAPEIIAGSPFSDGLSFSSGLSINRPGTLVYLSDFIYNEFSVMKIGHGGTLELAAGSPVSTGQSGGLFSLVAYPPSPRKACEF